jgi:hypothetical protein
MYLPEATRPDSEPVTEHLEGDVTGGLQGPTAPHDARGHLRKVPWSPSARIDHDDGNTGGGRGNHLDLAHSRPSGVDHTRVIDCIYGDRAPSNRDHVMRAVATKPNDTIVVDSERHPSAPRQTLGIPRHLLDLDRVVHPGQPVKLLSDQVGLQSTLGGRCNVLKVAPATLTRAGIATRRFNPVWGCLQHDDGISA